jgi:tetratricopeptide (TPR) repeat protein
VARAVGATYAVVGSAVQLGEELRLAAQVRRVPSGERLGQVEVEGPPGSVTALTDALTRKVLGVLLERSEAQIPSVDLESITTSSLKALKDFLRAERFFRAGEYEAAADGYEAALRKDSVFALAQYRLAHTRLWIDRARESLRRAYELRGRLPRRERRVLEALYATYVQQRGLRARDSLRILTEDYPEDPEVWYQYGDVIMHGYLPDGWEQTEKIQGRAAHLDPSFAEYHHHLVEIAMSVHQDGDLMMERIEAHPEGPQKSLYRVLWTLKFGDQGRQTAWARLDTLSLPDNATWVRDAFAHPADRSLKDSVLRRISGRPDVNSYDYQFRLSRNLIEQGQLEEGLSLADSVTDGGVPCSAVAAIASIGYLMRKPAVRSRVRPAGRTEGAEERFLCEGISLIEEGRGEELPRLIARAEESIGAGIMLDSTSFPVWANELRGYRAWKARNLKEAERLWSESKPLFWRTGSLWRGDLYREMGRLDEAEAWYRAAWISPLAHERLGRLYEKMDRPEDAIDAYERFIEVWRDADPELQSRVKKARRQVEVLREKRAAE